MALLGREFIAVPDDRKGQIVFKWPDITIRRFTRAIVNADEMALFVNTGQVVQTMGPGRHQIDANELPGLGVVIDSITGGNAYRAELYFVGTREYTGFKFGGRVDDVQDPRTGLVVTLRVFGDYALRVADPVRLVTNMTATVDVTDNERIAGWVSDQLLKVLRTHVTTQIIRNGWPILGLMAYSAEIEQATIDAANGQLVAYGVQLTRMGNFDVNLSPEDEKQLKQLAKDTSYSQLAGGFQNYAAGEMALGAGQGMAQGGAGVDGAFLGAGFGLASAMGAQQVANQQAQAQAAQQAAAQQGMPPYGQGGPGGQQYGGQPQPQGGQPQGGPPSQQASSGPVCASCQAPNPAGAKFCMGCGQALAPAVQHCTECGTELPPSAHFCSGCGTRVGG
ncbi:MAG TPA: SPFH domain-containing protein [Streptosporangiaceae bacterium]|nr:SPFH domain-containing protein [Streptosporangiaceae bacterium]